MSIFAKRCLTTLALTTAIGFNGACSKQETANEKFLRQLRPHVSENAFNALDNCIKTAWRPGLHDGAQFFPALKQELSKYEREGYSAQRAADEAISKDYFPFSYTASKSLVEFAPAGAKGAANWIPGMTIVPHIAEANGQEHLVFELVPTQLAPNLPYRLAPTPSGT